jgi:hypothetical protein
MIHSISTIFFTEVLNFFNFFKSSYWALQQGNNRGGYSYGGKGQPYLIIETCFCGAFVSDIMPQKNVLLEDDKISVSWDQDDHYYNKI